MQENASLLKNDSISITDLSHRVGWVKESLNSSPSKSTAKNDIDIRIGHAKFLDANTIEIIKKDGEKYTLSAGKVIS